MTDDIKLWLGILQSFLFSSQANCFFSLGKRNSIVPWSIRLSVPAVTVGGSSNVSGLLFWSALVGVPVQPHLPATGWVCWERVVDMWKSKRGLLRQSLWFLFCFCQLLLLELVCTAEIAIFSNYSWKDTVVIIVIDAIFSAKNQNWLWTWSELEGAKEARIIAPINVFSVFALSTGGNTLNKPMGLAFCIMKTFLKAVMLAKTLSVQLIILCLCGFNKCWSILPAFLFD